MRKSNQQKPWTIAVMSAAHDGPILRQGHLRKKGRIWHNRYFMLRHVPEHQLHVLGYYRKSTDKEAREWYLLGPHCTIDEKVHESSNKNKGSYTFHIHWSPLSLPQSPKSTKLVTTSDKRQKRMKYAAATAATAAVVLTGGIAGVGMAASVGMGAAGVGVLWPQHKRNSELALAADSREEAEEWRAAIAQCIKESAWPDVDDSNVIPLSGLAGSPLNPMPAALSVPYVSPIMEFDPEWKITCNQQNVVWTGRCGVDVPLCKSSVTVQATPDSAFHLLMDLDGAWYADNPTWICAEIVAPVDKHADVVYFKMRGTYWSSPRDFCLLRYWRTEQNGSLVIWFQSTTHPTCPEEEGVVRGQWLGGGFIIAPPKNSMFSNTVKACRLTCVGQIDPRGWMGSYLGRYFGSCATFGAHFVSQLSLVKSMLENTQFVQNDPERQRLRRSSSALSASAHMEGQKPRHFTDSTWKQLQKKYRGNLPRVDWDTPNATNHALHVLGIEWILTSKELAHHLMKRKVKSIELQGTLMWAINWILQGPRPGEVYCLTIFATPQDPHDLLEDSHYVEFLDGQDNDNFRNAQLSIIPSLQGTSTPLQVAVGHGRQIPIGKFVPITYHRRPGYMEIDIDLTSSPLVAGVVRTLLAQIPTWGIETTIKVNSTVLLSTRIHQLNIDTKQGIFCTKN